MLRPPHTQVIEPVLKSFARDLVAALSYLHSNGIIFCDLKPGNILVNEYSRLKLCDFALCRKIVDLVDDNRDLNKEGTPFYMPPELFDPKGVFSFASDIYSLGAVLYELACGRTPFTDENFTTLVKDICETPVSQISSISSEANDFIFTLLEKNPLRRPKWSQIMSHRWLTGYEFIQYDYPDEPHFEKFIQEKGYTWAGAAKDAAVPTITRSELLGDTKAGKNQDAGLTTQSMGLNGEQLLRLSLNVKKNMLREHTEFADNSKLEGQDLKIDKYTTINLGQTNQTSAVPQEDVQDKAGEDLSPQPQPSQQQQFLSNTQGLIQQSTTGKEGSQPSERSLGQRSTSGKTLGKKASSGQSRDVSPRLQPRTEALSGVQPTATGTTAASKSTNSVTATTVVLAEVTLSPTFGGLSEWLVLPSDRGVKPMMGNPEIETLEEFEYSANVDDVVLVDGNALPTLDKEHLEAYLGRLYNIAANNTAPKERLNLLNYFATISQNSDNANMILETLFMDLFVKLLKTCKTKQYKVVLCTILGLCLRHATNINHDLPKLGLVPVLIELLKDPNAIVRRRAMGTLGEYLFYGADQIDGTPEGEIWEIAPATAAIMLRILKTTTEDDTVKFYCMRTIENILSRGKPGGACDAFSTIEFIVAALNLQKSTKNQGIRNSAIIYLSSTCLVQPKYIQEVFKQMDLRGLLAQLADSEKKTQQAFMNLLALNLFYGGEAPLRELFDNQKFIIPQMVTVFEHGTVAMKCKWLIVFIIMATHDPTIFLDQAVGRLFAGIEKLSGDKNKHLKGVLKEFIALVDDQLQRCLNLFQDQFSFLLQKPSPQEDAEDAERREQMTESLVELLRLVSSLLASEYIQDSVLREERLLQIFSLSRFYDGFVLKTSGSEAQIADLVAMVLEQVIANRNMVAAFQRVICEQVIPYLAQSLDSRRDECRYVAVKWISTLLMQILGEGVLPEAQQAVKQFGGQTFLPKLKEVVTQANPIGIASIKLTRTLLDIDRTLRDYLFHFGVANTILGFLEINHEKCNANTIKVISYIIDSPNTKLKNLADDKFLDRVSLILQNISDPVQGEEIIELVNIYYRRVVKDAKLSIYNIEQNSKVEVCLMQNKKELLSLMGDVAIPLIKVHEKCVELLKNSQGVDCVLTQTHPGDLLETILCTDALLFCLDVPEDKVVDSALAQTLLNIVLANSDSVVLNFVAHILHLHLNYPGGLMTYKSESRLGQKVLEKLKTLSMDSIEYYVQVFEQVYAK